MRKLFKVDSVISLGVDAESKYLLINDEKVEGVYKEWEINLDDGNFDILDYTGCIITPGLIDAHNHLFTTALQLSFGFDLSPDTQSNFSRLLDKISNFSKANRFPWIVGRGINSDYFKEKRLPNRFVLDKAKNDKPIFLVHQSGHAAVCNSLALKIAGLNKSLPDPEGGIVERDSSGEPTGILHERAAMDIVRKKIPPYTRDDYKTALLNAQEIYLKEGITCVKDTGGNGAPIDEKQRVEVINEAEKEGKLKIRIAVALPIFTYSELQSKIKLSSSLVQSERVMNAGYKIFLDGSGVSKTAWMKEYWNVDLDTTDVGNKGVVRWNLEELRKVFDEISELDCNISVHAIGDAAVEHVLSLIKREKELHKKASFAIVHSYIPSEYDLHMMRQYDVAVETQPSFIYLLGHQIANNLGRARYERMFPLKSYLKHGVRVCISSDSPVSPFKPLYGIYSAINRKVKHNGSNIKVINEEESITFPEAINCYTINPAHVLRNSTIGSLERGKLADFVIWDSTILHVSEDSLDEVHPRAVYISGKKLYENN